MKYKYHYSTPEGFTDMWMSGEDDALTALLFEGSRDESRTANAGEIRLLPVFEQTIAWLDIYFGGGIPDFLPNYRIESLTPFRSEVMEQMLRIPYGEVVTYGEIADAIAKAHGIEKMSSRAVGGAVGWNPLCIMIPCHRVVGANRSLTGYGGGIGNKIKLLELEKHDMRRFIIPTRGTAL